MDKQNDLGVELASVRRQLEEAKTTSAAHKKQLGEAKAKAKAIIQRKMDEADGKVLALEEQNKLQAEELSTLKSMLREVDNQRDELSGKCTALGNQVQQLQHKNTEIQNQFSSLARDRDDAHKSASDLGSKARATEDDLEHQIQELRAQLESVNRIEEAVHEKQTEPDAEPNGADAAKDERVLSDVKNSVEALRNERDQLQKERDQLKAELQAERLKAELQVNQADETDEQSSFATREFTERPSKVGAPWEETRKAKERIEDLLKELDNTRSTADEWQNQHEKEKREAEAERTSLMDEINTSQCRIKDLQEDLKKSETALQEEREKYIQEQQSKSKATTPEGDEKTKILEAKVSEMERVVANKQAEISKVREKAKTYLRELNAEKRGMETRMKEEAEGLRKQLEEERNRVEEAEQQTQSASAEVDSCLALIRDKQKNIQMLKMTISTQETAAQEATREINSLRDEFSRYKERAKQALREKDNAAISIESKIEDATAELRSDLEASQKEARQVKTRLRQFEGVQQRCEELMERTERAEAAADSLRRDAAGVSNTNFTRLDALGEKLSNMEAELNAARVATEDAEAKLETSKMRLEATEKALRGTEVRAEEAERISQKTITKQRNHVIALEQELGKVRESAASAQRTAAAAAKALALSSSENGEGNPSSNPRHSIVREAEFGEREDVRSFGSPSAIPTNRATLSAAMAGHANSLGDRSSPTSKGQVLESELKMKDQQIMVLTSQIGELGANLDDVQNEAKLRSEQTALLKEEVKNLDAKLAAAEKLRNVIANVLSFTEEENVRVKVRRGVIASPAVSPRAGYFGLNSLLGSKR